MDEQSTNEYQKMYIRLHNPKIKEALEFFEQKKKLQSELRERLDAHQVPRIGNERAINRCARRYRKNIRLEVLIHYGGNPLKCACCGETIMEFLSIDHIEGGGTKHRKEIRKNGIEFYWWLRKMEYPDGYQVLCMNCNWGKRMNNGVCPHLKLKMNNKLDLFTGKIL